MDKQHQKSDKPDTEKRKREIREDVIDADATGLVSGEELISEAETILPLLPKRSNK